MTDRFWPIADSGPSLDAAMTRHRDRQEMYSCCLLPTPVRNAEFLDIAFGFFANRIRIPPLVLTLARP